MLTCTNNNRLDNIETTASLVAMLSDLLANRSPGAALTLSDTGVVGLHHIMELVTETLEEASMGLESALKESIANADAITKAQDAADAFREGYAEGISDSVGLREYNTAYFLGLRVGAQATAATYATGAQFTTKQDIHGRDLHHIVMDTISKGIDELRLQMEQTGEGMPPTPILTEPVSADDHNILADSKERHIA